MIDKLLNHPLEFLLVAVGIGIILYCAGKFVTHPLRFITELVRILLGEFDPKGDRLPVERINAVIIAIFFVLAVLSLIFEQSPSGVSQAVGAQSSSSVPWVTILCLVLLALAAFLSPTWILLLHKEQATNRDARRLLDLIRNAGNGDAL